MRAIALSSTGQSACREDLAARFGASQKARRIIVATEIRNLRRCRIVILDDFLTPPVTARPGGAYFKLYIAIKRGSKRDGNQADPCQPDEMRQFLVVIFLVGKLGRNFTGCDGERFHMRIAFSENDQRTSSRIDREAARESEAFLLNNTSHIPKDRARGPDQLTSLRTLAANLFPEGASGRMVQDQAMMPDSARVIDAS